MNLWQRLTRGLAELGGTLSPGHWAILVLLGLVVLGSAVGGLLWSGSTRYEILCTGLGAEECSTLVSSLRDVGIEVRIARGGSAVMVPEQSVHRARMVAAEEGLPSAGTQGFASFREPKIGITPFAERINYLSALQNELATTISSLEAVRRCRVHLALPERRVFAENESPPSASVVVALRGNRDLTPAQVSGIAGLVASAVQELDPQDVTVTDGRGRVLAGAGEKGVGAAAGDQWSYRRKVEKDLGEKAERMLSRVLGPGRCDVRVSAVLEFQDTRETRREYDPDKKVIVSETIEKEESTGGDTRVGGVVGSSGGSSSGGGQQTTQTSSPRTTEMERTETEYQVSETVEEVIRRGAKISRLSVAAFVDLPEGGGGGATSGSGVPTLPEIREVVKDAVGYDEQRGDSLQVLEATFKGGAITAAGMDGGLPPWVLPAAKYGALALLALVLLLIARRVLKGLRQATPHVAAELVGADDEEIPSGQSGDRVLRERVGRFVQQRPQEAGRLLEGWIEGEN